MDEEKIIQEMKRNGVFNKLNAIYLSLISKEGQKSNISILKPYKNMPKTQKYIIAADLVMEYLISFQFESTVESILAESENSPEFEFDSRTSKTGPLQLKHSQAPIKELIRTWLIDATTPFYDNRERLAAAFEKRYKGLRDESHSPKYNEQKQYQQKYEKPYYYEERDLSPPPFSPKQEPMKLLPPQRQMKEQSRKKSPPKAQQKDGNRKKSPTQKYNYSPPSKPQKISPQMKMKAQKQTVLSKVQPFDTDSILDMSTEDSWRPPLPQNLLRKDNQMNTSKQKPAQQKQKEQPFQYKPSYGKRQLNDSSLDDDIGSL